MSTFGAAFDALPIDTQEGILKQLRIRKKIYTNALDHWYPCFLSAVLIADRPGPRRPSTGHYTPFHSTTNSSLWINQRLVEAGIEEQKLLWFNATHADGTPFNPVHLQEVAHLKPMIIALGGKAEAWIKQYAPSFDYVKVFHPQYAKRFRAKEPYALIKLLESRGLS